MVGLGIVGVIAACTSGGGTSTATPTPDGGSAVIIGNPSSSGETTGLLPDGGTFQQTCFGAPFDTPVAITVALPNVGPSTKIEQVRLSDSSAVYARTDTGAAPTYVFEAELTASPPKLGGTENAILEPHPGESDLAPTLSTKTGLLMFTHGEIGRRVIWTAKTDAGTGAATSLGDGLSDDADPWLVIAKSLDDGRLYFGRGQATGSAMRIVYADLTTSIGEVSFQSVVTPQLPCPAGANDNCGRPVVTPDERLMLFASWSAGLSSSDFAMHEIALTTDASGTFGAGAPIDHPELGSRAVSWVSDDGCQVLLDGGLTTAGIFYASRTVQASSH